MDKCPDVRVLGKFLDGELSESAVEDILAHLATCDICMDAVRNQLKEETDLIRKLEASKPVLPRERSAPEEVCISRLLLLLYLTGLLSKENRARVESHLESCDRCVAELMHLQRSLLAPVEMEVDPSLFSLSPANAHEPGRPVLSIVLSATKGILELLHHTGELLSRPDLALSCRSKEAERKNRDSIVIRKDFHEGDISLECAIGKEFSGGETTLAISVMRLSTEEFVPNLELYLHGPQGGQAIETDRDGIVRFSGIAVGQYTIRTHTGETVTVKVE